jgi:hypothetical protein
LSACNAVRLFPSPDKCASMRLFWLSVVIFSKYNYGLHQLKFYVLAFPVSWIHQRQKHQYHE